VTQATTDAAGRMVMPYLFGAPRELREMFDQHFDRVTVTPSGKIMIVSLVWKGVDRPCVERWKVKNMSLAIELKEMISNVNNYDEIRMLVDRDGKTFIGAKIWVSGQFIRHERQLRY
jgi:hypothetical protein